MSSNPKHVVRVAELSGEASQDPCTVSREKQAPPDHSYQGPNLHALNYFPKSFSIAIQEKGVHMHTQGKGIKTLIFKPFCVM